MDTYSSISNIIQIYKYERRQTDNDRMPAALIPREKRSRVPTITSISSIVDIKTNAGHNNSLSRNAAYYLTLT
jgi:hypothetical protein